MSYKDKEEERKASKERMRRYRELKKGVTEGVTTEGVTEGVTRKPLIHLSDGQAFDPNIDMPMKVPAGWTKENWCHAMAASNRAQSMKPLNQLTPEQKEELKARYNLTHDENGNWRPPTREEITSLT